MSGRPPIGALLVYSLAMGWLEAVVVVYIRGLLGIARGETIPPPAEVLPAIDALPWLLATEQSRETATIVMLAAVAWLAVRTWRARLGAFLFCFGIWDVAYYLALYAQLRWPPSPLTRDLLFLIPPHPWWYQPVWIPIAISAVLVAVGTRLLVAGGRVGEARPAA